MNITDGLETGRQLLNNTISGTNQAASILASKTGIPDFMWIIGLMLLLMWSLKGKGTSLFTWGIIALLLFVIVSSGKLW